MAQDREQEPVQEREPTQETKVAPDNRILEPSGEDFVRKGTDVFDVAVPTPTEASPLDLMSSMAPEKVAEPQQESQASSE